MALTPRTSWTGKTTKIELKMEGAMEKDMSRKQLRSGAMSVKHTMIRRSHVMNAIKRSVRIASLSIQKM